MGEKDVLTLAKLFSCYMLGAAPFVASLVYIRAISALGKTKILMIGAVVSVISNIVFNFVFTEIFLLIGIGLATSLTHLIHFLWLCIAVRFLKLSVR